MTITADKIAQLRTAALTKPNIFAAAVCEVALHGHVTAETHAAIAKTHHASIAAFALADRFGIRSDGSADNADTAKQIARFACANMDDRCTQ